jgi:hypothetical protein
MEFLFATVVHKHFDLGTFLEDNVNHFYIMMLSFILIMGQKGNTYYSLLVLLNQHSV